MSHLFGSTLFSVTLLLLLNESTSTVQILTEVIQKNVFGVPLLHESQNWPFDPDAGLRKAAQYEQENGVKGEKLIERIGLGVDGKQQQRLLEQRTRDEGHLGGLNFFRP